MKFICALCIIMLTAVCGNSEETSKNVESEGVKICQPNANKMKDCNRCKCAANGQHWLCTRKLCLDFANPNSENFVCTPNKVFKYECNTCTCNANGNGASCTEMICNGVNENIQSNPELQLLSKTVILTTTPTPSSSDECVPGTQWRKDCNNCYCTSTKVGICTLRGCGVRVPSNIPILNNLRPL